MVFPVTVLQTPMNGKRVLQLRLPLSGLKGREPR